MLSLSRHTPMRGLLGLPSRSVVRADVVDVTGRRVASLLVNHDLAAGTHRLTWDRRDATRRRVVPGVYLLRVSTAAGEAIRRVAIIE